MRVTRPLLLFLAVAMMAGGCARDPVIGVQMAPMAAPQGIDNVVYGGGPAYATAPVAAAPSYAASGYPAAPAYATARPTYAAPTYAAAAPAYAAPSPAYAAAAPAYAATTAVAAPVYANAAAPMVATTPAAYGYASYPYGVSPQYPYTLDSGDRLRIVVFGQDGLTNSYVLDASGNIDMPLIGTVAARGLTTDQLSARISGMLQQGFVREPHVAVEIEAYRPFFILGEVGQPGQYPYVANMTVETAVAIAGGFGPRGDRRSVIISRNYGGQVARFEVPITAPVQPGDTIRVQERWF